jgi:hypothetical protein
MNPRSIATAVIAALLLFPAPSRAAEPRPWLCRDKPVFSADKPVVCEIDGRSSRWRVFFMQFEAGAAHDGFDIVAQKDPTGSSSVPLGAGQYFVVALYRATSGHWICPERAEKSESPPSGAIASLCFGEEESSACAVTLTVREAGSGPAGAGAAR